jgi:hypothetical protein
MWLTASSMRSMPVSRTRKRGVWPGSGQLA